MACPHVTIRRRLVATGLAAGLTAGCVLNRPPDAAGIKEMSMPTVEVPPQFPAPTIAGPVVDGWLASFNDKELVEAVIEALAYNNDLRVAATRVEQANLNAKLAGARLYPSADVLAR